MKFVEKLSGVTLNSDTLISDADREFCKAHQRAYDEVRQILAELEYVWEETINNQKVILDEVDANRGGYSDYIRPSDFNISKFEQKQQTIHTVLINNIVRYFNDTYRVNLGSDKIVEFLIPKKPEYSWRHDEEYQEQYDEWEKKMDALSLKYTDILDQLLVQLDGRTFAQYAVDEMKQECHKLSWNTYNGIPCYLIKGDAVTFKGNFCYESYSSSKWELYESSKPLLPALGHFESGELDYSAFPINELKRGAYTQQVEFRGWQKVVSLKMFKNGRLDIKFSSSEYANEFVEQYLGLVC